MWNRFSNFVAVSCIQSKILGPQSRFYYRRRKLRRKILEGISIIYIKSSRAYCLYYRNLSFIANQRIIKKHIISNQLSKRISYKRSEKFWQIDTTAFIYHLNHTGWRNPVSCQTQHLKPPQSQASRLKTLTRPPKSPRYPYTTAGPQRCHPVAKSRPSTSATTPQWARNSRLWKTEYMVASLTPQIFCYHISPYGPFQSHMVERPMEIGDWSEDADSRYVLIRGFKPDL